MKVLKIYDYHRRDCYCDLKCENCGELITNVRAYDDRYYWDIVIPNRKCEKCGKSSKELNIKNKRIRTRYQEGHQV